MGCAQSKATTSPSSATAPQAAACQQWLSSWGRWGWAGAAAGVGLGACCATRCLSYLHPTAPAATATTTTTTTPAVARPTTTTTTQEEGAGEGGGASGGSSSFCATTTTTTATTSTTTSSSSGAAGAGAPSGEGVAAVAPRMKYGLKAFSSPRMTGWTLSTFAFIFEKLRILRKISVWLNGGAMFNHPESIATAYTWYPMTLHPAFVPSEPIAVDDVTRIPDVTHPGFQFPNIMSYYHCYERGGSPVVMARNLLMGIAHSNEMHKLRAVVEYNAEAIMSQAQESEARWKAGRPLSVLDGVPIAIKDQLQVMGHNCGCGGPLLRVAEMDCTVAARLRRLGAIVYGMTNMSEFGLHTTGHNAHPRYGHAKNPYSPIHDTGGSSSGSAAAVAAGLGPVAIGVDGGGSIRVPSASCGLYGLKTTTGRVSSTGDMLCWGGGTVDVIGPIAANPRDCAIVLAAIAGEDLHDPATYHSPALSMLQLNRTDLSGITIGIYPEWFNDSSPRILSSCRKFLCTLERLGAEIKEIQIPWLQETRLAHSLVISTEIAACGPPRGSPFWKQMHPSSRVMCSAAADVTAYELLCAAKYRAVAIQAWDAILRQVDVVATPALGDFPPEGVRDGDALDLARYCSTAKYMFPANFTGLPAIVFPVDYSEEKGTLPIGMQIIGRAWTEDLLIRIAELASTHVTIQQPAIYYDLLGGVGPAPESTVDLDQQQHSEGSILTPPSRPYSLVEVDVTEDVKKDQTNAPDDTTTTTTETKKDQ
ncbi:aspartyl-tRNA amidotransferase [Pelomyxa schiedti]|nr:aspartyl-tRNA amidotransferase [Pelomyxa schiedti]